VLLLALQSQPHIIFVDIISVLERTLRLQEGADFLHPLYPVGYPLFLSLFPVAWQLITAKILNLVFALILLWTVTNHFSYRAGIGLLCCGVWMQWGGTEGTDMLAAALSILALIHSKNKPWLAIVLISAACLTRYTAFVTVPIVLLLSPKRVVSLTGVVLLTSPHWAMMLWFDQPLFDQTENIIRGQQNSLLHKSGMTLLWLLQSSSILGVLGLWKGRNDGVTRYLIIYLLMHIIVVIMVFPNARLLLPALLISSFGWHYFSFRWMPVVLLCGIFNHMTLDSNEEWKVLAKLANHKSMQQGTVLSSSPKVYSIQQDETISSIPLREVNRPHLIDPKMLVQWSSRNNINTVVIREEDCQRNFKALIYLFRKPLPPNVIWNDCVGEWCVFGLRND
jgi:hypothetical protein